MGPENRRRVTGRLRENPVMAKQQNWTGKEVIYSGSKKKEVGESGNNETGELQHKSVRWVLEQVPEERTPEKTENENKYWHTGRKNNGHKEKVAAASVWEGEKSSELPEIRGAKLPENTIA